MAQKPLHRLYVRSLLTSQLANAMPEVVETEPLPLLELDPAAMAAGRRWSQVRTLLDPRCFPLALALANTQSLGRP